MLDNRRNRVFFLMAFVLAAALVVLYCAHAPSSLGANQSTSPSAPDQEGNDAQAPGRVAAATHVAPNVSLPPSDAPLKETYKELANRAESGDVAASMRLYRDLRTCVLRRPKQDELNRIYFRRAGQGAAAYAQQVQTELNDPRHKRALEGLEQSDALCDGVDATQLNARGDFLRQAAMQGDADGTICYLSAIELGPDYLSDAWFNYAAQWRLDAPVLAQRALDAGDPRILDELISAYWPDNTRLKGWLSGVYSPDAQIAYELTLVRARVSQGWDLKTAQDDLSHLADFLKPEQTAAATAIADQLSPRFSAWNGSSAPPKACAEMFHTAPAPEGSG